MGEPTLFEQPGYQPEVGGEDLATAVEVIKDLSLDRLRRLWYQGFNHTDYQALLIRLEDAERQRDALLRSRSTARAGDPATSHEGASRARARDGAPATFRPGSQKHRLLVVYGCDPVVSAIHDHAAAVLAGLDRPGVCWWKRCSELRQAGLIETTGQTAVDDATGSERELCRITDTGRRYLTTLGPVTR